MSLITYRHEISEKKATLAKLEEDVKKAEDLAFELTNQKSPLGYYTEEHYRILLAEDKRLRDILNIKNQEDSLSEAFKSIVRRRNREIKRRQEQADELRHRLHLLKRELRNISLPTSACDPHETRKLIKTSLNDYNMQIKMIHDFIKSMREQFIKEVNSAKEKLKQEINRRKQEELKHIKEYQDMFNNYNNKIEQLKKERDQIQKEADSLSNSKDVPSPVKAKQDPEELQQRLNDIYRNKRRVLNKCLNRMKRPMISVSLIAKINADIDALKARIDIVIEKIKTASNKIEQNRKIEEAKRIKERMLQARVNFQSLLRIGRLGITIQKVADKIDPWFDAQYKLIRDRMKKQQYDNVTIVEDTGMTISELRKEILRLEKLTFQINFNGARNLEDMERERAQLIQLTTQLTDSSH